MCILYMYIYMYNDTCYTHIGIYSHLCSCSCICMTVIMLFFYLTPLPHSLLPLSLHPSLLPPQPTLKPDHQKIPHPVSSTPIQTPKTSKTAETPVRTFFLQNCFFAHGIFSSLFDKLICKPGSSSGKQDRREASLHEPEPDLCLPAKYDILSSSKTAPECGM